jgi:hypothetical protein
MFSNQGEQSARTEGEEVKQEKKDVCGKCSIVVAPQEPGKVAFHGFIFHENCWKKLQKAANKLKAMPTQYAQQ